MESAEVGPRRSYRRSAGNSVESAYAARGEPGRDAFRLVEFQREGWDLVRHSRGLVDRMVSILGNSGRAAVSQNTFVGGGHSTGNHRPDFDAAVRTCRRA